MHHYIPPSIRLRSVGGEFSCKLDDKRDATLQHQEIKVFSKQQSQTPPSIAPIQAKEKIPSKNNSAMRNLGRQLALLALSGVLLVNLGLNATAELVKQEEGSPSLPALVASDDESPASTSSPSSQTTISDTTAASLPTTSATAAAASSLAPNAGPQEDKESSSTPIKTASQDEAQQVSGSDKSGQQAKESSVVPEAPAKEDSATESSQPKLPAASPVAEEASTGEKDIRVLLANKNDAENDLNSPPVEKEKFSPSGPTLIVVTSTDKKEPVAELDAPVDVNSGTGESQGNSDKPLSGSDSGDQATTTSSTTTEKPSLKQDEQAKKDEVDDEAPISEKPVEQEPSKKEAEQPAKEKTEPPKEENSPDGLIGKKADSGAKVEPVAVKPAPDGKPEQSPANGLSPSEEGDNSSSEAPTTAAPTTTSAPQESSTGAPTTQSSNAESSTTEKAKEPSKQVKPVVASNPPVISEEPAKSGEGELKDKTQALPEPKKPAESDKPVSVPSILATALGTALGNAVNPLYKNLGGKEKPLIATRNLTTTKAPTASSTTRKSSTDKWDRWSPSSPATPTTGSPPTRLRPLPILPSIRRRFRPYNRFSPFPFGGPDSYSPSEGELTPPVVGPGGSRFPGGSPTTSTSTSTSRPKRRRTSTTGPTKPASEDEADEEVSLKPQDTSGSRRRGQGSNRRRHHNHNHNHHHHHQPHQPHNQGESEFGGRRHHHKQHGTRNFERDEPFGSDGISPGGSPFGDHGNPHRHGPRPISPGFSLFNSGATGSGFDLLNPFSGWLDDAIRPARRPPVGQAGPGSTIGSPGRRPGSQPIPVGGDYNDEHAPSEHDHHHHDHHSRPHNGRDDYHDHHHDCDHHHEHEHDHDHGHDHGHDHHHRDREPYRPIRPQREPVRPPIGGDYDPYPSSASFGRRPSRPYNRRDQAEVENKEQNQGGSAEQASPGLYASIAPVAPRRVPSIFSPFDSLFGSLDDDLFSLRSSFIDTPAKEASHAFDTILTSPKISMPGAVDSAARSVGKEGEDKNASNNNNNSKDAPAIKPTGEQEANNNNDLARRGSSGSVVIPKRQ